MHELQTTTTITYSLLARKEEIEMHELQTITTITYQYLYSLLARKEEIEMHELQTIIYWLGKRK